MAALVTLLREAGMVPERFEPNDVFAPGFDSITTTLGKLHKRMGIHVGINLARQTLSSAANVYEPRRNSQIALQNIEVYLQTQAVTWDPRSTELPFRGT